MGSASGRAWQLWWPANDLAFQLQFTTNLAGTNGVWVPVSEPSFFFGTNRLVTNGSSGPQKFYRLMKP